MREDKQYSPVLSQRELGQTISALGRKKTERNALDLLLLGVLAGIYISVGGHLYLVTLSGGLSKVIGGAVFSVGLVLVVIAGAELFTGNIIIVVAAITRLARWRRLLKNWVMVYLGNLIGSVAYALLVYRAGLFGAPGGDPNALGELAAGVATAKIALPFAEAFIRGVFANMLVILAIIMSIMAKEIVSKVVTIVLPIMAFVAMGFEHSVANMFLIPVGLLAGRAPLSEFGRMWANIGPVTLGNIVGGLVILLIHPNRIKQVADLLRRRKKQ